MDVFPVSDRNSYFSSYEKVSTSAAGPRFDPKAAAMNRVKESLIFSIEIDFQLCCVMLRVFVKLKVNNS